MEAARIQVAWPNRLTVACVAVAALVFLTLPLVIVVPMSFSSANNLVFPPPALSLRPPNVRA